MSLLTNFLIAFGLSADAFAVSVSTGIALRKPRLGDALKVGLAFGVSQAVMRLLGWVAGYGLKALIVELDHWVAFGLLAAIGGKMIYEAARKPSDGPPLALITPSLLLVLSLATSIDAIAVGVSLSFLIISIALPAAIIGVTTFFLSCCGVFIGDRCGRLFERKVAILGGLILIAIGIKILAEHEFFNMASAG